MTTQFCTVSDPWTDFAYLGMVVTDEGFDYVTLPDPNGGLDPARRIDAFVRMSGRDVTSLTLIDFKMIAARSCPMQKISSWVRVDTFEEAREAILRVLNESNDQRVMRELQKAQGRVVRAYEETRNWADADDPADLWRAGLLQDFVLDAVEDRSLEGPNGWLARKQLGLAPEPGDELGFIVL